MSSDDGRNMMSSIQQVRRLMFEVSSLLREADAIMGVDNWEPRAGSTAIFGNATSIFSPLNWVPYQVFRFYKHADMGLAVPCVSVVLESSDSKVKLTEPHISAILMEYESEKEVPVGVSLYQIASWHFHLPQRKDDGSIVTFEPRASWSEHSSAKKMTSFALPLVAIQNREDLQGKVISPLMTIIRDSQSTVAPMIEPQPSVAKPSSSP